MILGIHGKLGSGKDTVYDRIVARYPDAHIKRLSFADKLKDSACALLGISREQMEVMKRADGFNHLALYDDFQHECDSTARSSMSMRTFLQRYGTEAHRDVFGQNFWVDHAIGAATMPNWLYIFTDVRFENEAEAIIERGGQVWRVIGINENTGDHASERPLSDDMISYTIDNSARGDGFAHIDSQLAIIEPFVKIGMLR